MLWVFVIIGGIILVCISNPKSKQAESTAVNRCKNSDFFSEVQNYLANDFLIHYEGWIRDYVRYDYDRYDKSRHEKNSPESRFKPSYCSYGIEIHSFRIQLFGFIGGRPVFDFQEHGYNNLDINQMRTLVEALRSSNNIWGNYKFRSSKKYSATNDHVILYLNECYVKSIVDDEVKKLVRQPSKYSYKKAPF